MPTVTLAVPCYNGAAFIDRTIEALLQQTYPADALLVIDDGSTDNSEEIIRRYPVRLIQHPKNRGLSQARNTALENTQTDILAFVDADAFASADMLSTLIHVFESHPEVSGVGGQGIEAVQKTIHDRWRSLHAFQGQGKQMRYRCEYLSGLCMAYRADVLRQVGGFDTNLRTNGEDMDIGFRLNDAGFVLVYTPDARVYHQRQDNEASLRRMMHQWYYWAYLVKKKNHRSAWTLFAGTLRRLLWSDTVLDLFSLRDLRIVRLDIILGLVKMQALIAAFRSTKDTGR